MKWGFSPKAFREFMVNVVLVCVSLFFCLFVLEIALRIMPPEVDLTRMIIISDGIRIRNVGMKANRHTAASNPVGAKIHYVTNSDGFRDFTYSEEKASGVFRIIGLGDSFAYGVHVSMEECYLKVLENLLNKSRAGTYRFEVLNLGECDTGQKQQFDMLREIGMKYKPDLVLLGFYVGNDFYDNVKELTGSDIEPDVQHGRGGTIFQCLKRRSKAVLFLARKWVDFEYAVGIKKYGKEELFMDNFPVDIKRASVLAEKLIVEIDAFLKTYKVPLYVIIIPTGSQLDYCTNEKFRKRCEEGIEINKPQSELKRILDKNSIPYLDLLEIFKNEQTRLDCSVVRYDANA